MSTIRLRSDVRINGDLVIEGGAQNGIQTPHDAFYWAAGDTQFNGTAAFTDAAAADTGFARWAFDATTVERIKWVWTPPAGWASFTIRIGWLNDGAGAGNVVWRYKHFGLLFGGNPGGAITDTYTSLPLAAPAASGAGYQYSDLAVAVPISLGFFGESPTYNAVIDRFASDAGDTLANDASILQVTATRV